MGDSSRVFGRFFILQFAITNWHFAIAPEAGLIDNIFPTLSDCAFSASENCTVCRNASGVSLPRLGVHGFAFPCALLLIRADQNDFRANQKERE